MYILYENRRSLEKKRQRFWSGKKAWQSGGDGAAAIRRRRGRTGLVVLKNLFSVATTTTDIAYSNKSDPGKDMATVNVLPCVHASSCPFLYCNCEV